MEPVGSLNVVVEAAQMQHTFTRQTTATEKKESEKDYKCSEHDDDDDFELSMLIELHNAATNGTVEQLQQILERIITERNESPLTIIDRAKLSETSLIHAALNGGNEDVALFLAQGVPSLTFDTNVKGDTALHIATRCGMLRIVRFFAESQVGDICVRPNELGNIALHEAVMTGNFEAARILISRNPLSICYENKQGLCALHLAIRNGNYRIFEHMLDLICHDHELYGRFDEAAEPPAHAAIWEGKIDFLQQMEKKCKKLLKLRDKKGQTPLHCAVEKGDIEAVRFLLKRSLTYFYQMDKRGFLPIHIAAHKGHVQVMMMLIECCSDPAVLLTEEKGQTILHIAAENGKDGMVKYMLGNPITRKLLNERDNDGNTPLHLAAKNSHPAVVLSLTWSKNIDLNPLNNECLSPLDVFGDSKLDAYFEQHLLQHEMTLTAMLSAGCEPSYGKNTKKKSSSSERSLDAEINKESNKVSKKPQKYEWMNDNVGALLTIATLVATGTFTMGFTMPGGSIGSGEKNEGMPILLSNHTFQFFMICNTIAFFSSVVCIISCFYTKYADILVAARAYYLAVVLFGFSLLMMSLAFTAAIHLAIRNVSWLSYATLVAAVLFLVFLFLAWVVDAFPLHWRNPIVRFMSYYVIRGCMFVFLRKY